MKNITFELENFFLVLLKFEFNDNFICKGKLFFVRNQILQFKNVQNDREFFSPFFM